LEQYSLRVRIGNGLLALNLLVIVLVIVVFLFPYDIVQVILGLSTVFLFPGYTLMAALFPRRGQISNAERLALSLGMSITVLPLIGLILNYTLWGIRLESILYSVVLFIFAMSVIAWFRQKKLAGEERFNIEFQLGIGNLGKHGRDRVLSIVLVVTMVGVVGMLGYVMLKPKIGQKFTEFYILGSEGNAADYPKKLAVGQKGNVTVVIANQEYEAVFYQIEVRIDTIKIGKLTGIELMHGERWEGNVEFVTEVASEYQILELFLYKKGESEPYLKPLRLRLNVRE